MISSVSKTSSITIYFKQVCIILCCAYIFTIYPAIAETSSNQPPNLMPAFPGAEGFGAYTTGGRGGAVLKVTNLNSSGPGSLQHALNEPYPRLIVFDISGVIQADKISIPHGNVTIAGQTSPGGGVTIEGRLVGAFGREVKNIIIRHVRIRPPEFKNKISGNKFDAVQLSKNSNIILDHVSMSFGVDEVLDLYSAKNITVQWCVIEQAAVTGHPEGNHNFGLINGPAGGRISVLNNLFAHLGKRAPALSAGPAETINNVMYNIKDNWLHHNPASGLFVISNNYFRRGPSSAMTPFLLDAEVVSKDLGYFIESNYIDDPEYYVGILSPWKSSHKHPSSKYFCSYFKGSDCRDFKLNTRPHFEKIKTYLKPKEVSYLSAYDQVLKRAGAFPRDSVTKASVRDVINRTGVWGAHIPNDLMDGLRPGKRSLDTDNDGLPDNWELANNLDPTNPKDVYFPMSSGYDAIEQYMNELAEELI